jgi:signal transduction histidine kinase
MPLLNRYAVEADERRDRLEFLGVSPADSENLRALRTLFADYSREFVERFYQHLLSTPKTAALLQDPEQLEHLKRLQASYFLELLEGTFDDAYFESRLRVGLAHQRVGLDPVWYLGAYNQYIQLTFPLFARAFGQNLDKALPHLLSLVKVIFLDIGLALHTFFRKDTEELRQHNEQLQQALGLYWQVQRREEQMHKLISHEVRGGLAAMITSLDDLLETANGQLDPSIIRELEVINRRCWSLSNVLGEMLAAGKESGAPTWVETAPIFENLVARFGLYAEGRAIHLHLPEHAPRVWADAVQLREVFANLISNAVRYLDKEPGRIEVTCRAEGEFYLFGVADNGPGIPANVREKLFEPFIRGSGAATKRLGGTGLGLYFVRTMVEQQGGRVWIESEPGHGTRVWFTIPRVPPATASRRPDNESPISSAGKFVPDHG